MSQENDAEKIAAYYGFTWYNAHEFVGIYSLWRRVFGRDMKE